MIILELNNVRSGYGRIDIIRGVDLKVEKGSIVSVIGPNGAGKSTLFKTIFGILKVRSGSIHFNGEDITNLSSTQILAKGISYVPQGRCNFPMMTVQENLEMGAYSRKDDKVKDDIREIFERLPTLKKYKNEMAGNLSGGEQQLLEMGMALLLHPKIMLLDEPSLGLAPKLVELVFEKILEIHKEFGTTLMIVEQNAKKALSISDYAFVLELGKKRFEGPAREIMNNREVKMLYLGGEARPT
jgi:branched-chain amino acid transport system ATP-binding protein